MKKILLTLALVATLISCKQPILKDGTEPEVKETPKPKKVVVVQRISLSEGKYQNFIVSGGGFGGSSGGGFGGGGGGFGGGFGGGGFSGGGSGGSW